MAKGDGLITSLGWDIDEDGRKFFRAIVEFPEGPPPIPPTVIWKSRPVRIEINAPQPTEGFEP